MGVVFNWLVQPPTPMPSRLMGPVSLEAERRSDARRDLPAVG
jgi:hypothetical protein